jgi:FixJ family two-component response regulator
MTMISPMTMISVVDDDPFVRSATVDLLNSFGFVCDAYASAEEYLGSGRIANTSCLILDVKMPGLNGLELQTQLIETGRRIPIIFVTSFPEESARAKAIGAGAICFLPKPYSEEHLLNCIHRALRPT